MAKICYVFYDVIVFIITIIIKLLKVRTDLRLILFWYCLVKRSSALYFWPQFTLYFLQIS